MDAATGREKWTRPTFGQGEVLLVGGKLIVQSSQGEVALVEPAPDGYKEIARAQVLGGQTWGYPAFSGGLLICRNEKQVAAFSLPPPATTGN